MPEVTIDPKHARLQNFLAAKGVTDTQKKVTIEVSNTELTSMIRKAKEHGYENLVKYNKADLKKAAVAVVAETEPVDEDPSDETTADQEIEEAEEADKPAKPRKRRVP